MSINRNARNVAIVLAIAAVVAIVPAGGWGASFVLQLVSLAFLAAIAWVASRLYREHRVAIYSLGDRRRAVLYGAVAIATLVFSASDRLLHTGPGSVVFLVALAACAVAIYRVFRSTKSY